MFFRNTWADRMVQRQSLRELNYSDRSRTDIHPTLAPSAGCRSEVDPSTVKVRYSAGRYCAGSLITRPFFVFRIFLSANRVIIAKMLHSLITESFVNSFHSISVQGGVQADFPLVCYQEPLIG